MKTFLVGIMISTLVFSSYAQNKPTSIEPIPSPLKKHQIDYTRIKLAIKQKYGEWLEKGEFEKSTEHRHRVSTNSSTAFDSICYVTLTEHFNETSGFSMNLLKYNADSEKFGISFNDGTFRDSLSVPIKDASNFKAEFENFSLRVDGKNLRFLDGNIIPCAISLYKNNSNERFQFHFSNKNFKKIVFSTADLGFSTANNINHTFDLDGFYFNRKSDLKDDVAKSRFSEEFSQNASVEENKEYEKVEIEASVNIAQWRRHLENQTVRYIEDAAESGMPPGNYTVNVRFLVEKDGSINSIQPLNDPGHGLAQGAVEIIKRGPKWTPGEQNGRKVRSYHTQPITFQIQER